MGEYKMRRDNLISPWGVGAIVPFPHDESLMVGGLDKWFDDEHSIDDFLIIDERLTKRLGGKLFVTPPDYRTSKQDKENAFMKIPAVRFPLWQYCPVCGNMEKVGISGDRRRCSGEIRKGGKKKTYCSEAKAEKRPFLIPERFIAVCEAGHIEDFPIMEWVHTKSDYPITSNCKLVRSTGGGSSSLSGVRYTCSCGASASMQEAFYKESLDRIGYFCKGRRPWLGLNTDEDCGRSLTVLQRGASNVWFADVISSIYIPWLPKYTNTSTKECISKGVNKFKSSLTNGDIDKETIKKFVEAYKMMFEDVDDQQAYDEIISTLSNVDDNKGDSEEEYRKQEFDVLTRDAGKPSDELFVKNYSSSKYENLQFLKSVSLVHKLRETRVFTGFSRLSPGSPIKSELSVNEKEWLPAVKNSGEGIMLEFNYDYLLAWSKQENVINRAKIIENNLKTAGGLNDQEINPVYLLLHTISHCLIIALSNESGYSNASIREKIYCPQFKTEDNKMAGILIYTASGDAEGSLGGLVRQGLPGKLEEIIKHAISEARWCAADPVCIQSPGQGQDGCNLAACHNCALLPETSCENKNKLLDRGLMIGTLNDESVGFFNNEVFGF